MKKATIAILVLTLVIGISLSAKEETQVPFSAIKSSCYGEIDMSKTEFDLSEVSKECVIEQWLEENRPEEKSSDLEKEGEITLNEIVVKRGQRRTIEGKEILLKGNLYVHPNASLHLKNTHLKISQHHKAQRWIAVERNSDLIIEDSIIEQVDFVTDRPRLKDFMHTNLVIRDHGASTVNYPGASSGAFERLFDPRDQTGAGLRVET